MEDNFIKSCKKLNIQPITIQFDVTEDVYHELQYLSKKNNSTLSEFLRDMVDDYILCSGEYS